MASSSYQPSPADHGGEHDGHHHHITPLSTLLGVFGALVVLTIFTVLFAHPDIKALAQWFIRQQFYDMSDGELVRFSTHLAMVIASVKGILVALYFMHLRHDRPFNVIMFIFTMLIVALFIGYVLMDTTQYTKNESYRTNIQQTEFWLKNKDKRVKAVLPQEEPESDGVTRPEGEDENTEHSGDEHSDENADEEHSDEEHSDDEHADEEHSDETEPPAGENEGEPDGPPSS